MSDNPAIPASQPESNGGKAFWEGKKPLALCLSGGGFRATFFHLGVVKRLQELGCLKRITHVFSVSGGSILAAQLALDWKQIVDGDNDAFRKLSSELIELGTSDLRGWTVRRGVFWWNTLKLKDRYNAHFNGRRLEDLPVKPAFYFLTTSMRSGQLCAFTRDHLIEVKRAGEGEVDDPAKIVGRVEGVPLATAVAASSAFPLLFPPLKFTIEPTDARREVAFYFTDGGVFDNAGLSRIHRFVDEPTKKGYGQIIVSDASAVFDDNSEAHFPWPFGTMSRVTDVMMERIEFSEREMWRETGVAPFTLFRIGDIVDSLDGATQFMPQPKVVQKYLKEVRTDIDIFDIDLIRSLGKHGYEVALKGSNKKATERLRPWDPCSPDRQDADRLPECSDSVAFAPFQLDSIELAARIKAASRSPWGLWNKRDLICWMWAVGVAGLVVSLGLWVSFAFAAVMVLAFAWMWGVTSAGMARWALVWFTAAIVLVFAWLLLCYCS